MPLLLVQTDITTMQVDAIVNAANESLLGGGGVDGAIHRAAGPELLAECRTLHGCKTGQAKLTGGYRLPAKFVIHTVGPIWRGGTRGEPELLASAYRSSLELALAHRCETVAFPLISSGVYGYPKDRALKVAVDTIGAFLLAHDMLVYLVIFDRATYTIGAELSAGIDAHLAGPGEPDLRSPAPGGPDKAPGQPDESFAQMLLRQIGQRGLTDAQCCRRANLDRGLLSQVRSDVHYPPSPPPWPLPWPWSSPWRRPGNCSKRRASPSPAPAGWTPSWSTSSPGATTIFSRSTRPCSPLIRACWADKCRPAGPIPPRSPYSAPAGRAARNGGIAHSGPEIFPPPRPLFAAQALFHRVIGDRRAAARRIHRSSRPLQTGRFRHFAAVKCPLPAELRARRAPGHRPRRGRRRPVSPPCPRVFPAGITHFTPPNG